MGDSEFFVVLVALIVSVIALIVTAFQLSAQIFLTAEGQRKCSESLLSVWSKDPTTKTRWKWRWSEARFELQFVTPEICLGTSASPILDGRKDAPGENRSLFGGIFRNLNGAGRVSERKTESILGADSELDYVLFLSALAYNAPDMVSWLSFLTFLRLETSDSKTETDMEKNNDASLAKEVAPEETCNPTLAPLELSWPRVKYRVHSWDYMPPNAPKPFAKFTIHDVAVLVRRSGMIWKTFDPMNGNMSAEGGAHILTGSLIQGLGLVLEYRCLDDMSLAIRVSQRISVMSLKTDPFTQSRMDALRNAQADSLGLAPGGFQKSDDESRMASEVIPEGRDESGRIAQGTRIWLREMDKFVFGLVPGDPRLGLPDYPFVEVSDRLNVVLPRHDWQYSGLREKILKDANLDWQCSFNDLMAIVPPILKTRHSGSAEILPFRFDLDKESVFTQRTLFTFERLLGAFLNGGTKSHQRPFKSMRECNLRLTEENIGETMLGQTGLLQGRDDGGTTQMKRILAGVETITRRYYNSSKKGKDFYEDLLHEYHDSTTQYFIENKPYIKLPELLKAFLSKAPLAAAEVRRNKSEEKYITDFRSTGFDITTDYEIARSPCTLEHYFSYIPDYIENTNGVQPVQRFEQSNRVYRPREDVVIEAWLTMMWRGYLFKELHFFMEMKGIHVPYEYYGSRLPVYMI